MRRGRFRAAAVAAFLSAITPAAFASPTFTPLYWFRTAPIDGQVYGALAYSNNTLYGASISAHGTIFQLTPPATGTGAWRSKVLHIFNGDDGDSPYGALLLDPPGPNATPQRIFGTTETGTANVFELTAPATASKPWGLTALHTFTEFTPPDRADMFSGMIADKLVPSRLLGVAPLGGPESQGTVFALTPPAQSGGKWTETVLYRFADATGSQPEGGLIQDTDGSLYGTTKSGGKAFYGTVFKLSPPAAGNGLWTHTTLYSFTGRDDGGFPGSALAFDSSHQHIFGAASVAVTGQEGSIYRLTRPAAGSTKWTYSRIHTFTSTGGDGGEDSADDAPGPGVVIDAAGNLYGATPSGGQNILGTIYKLTKPATENGVWVETILHAFTGRADGGAPYAALTMGTHGEFYGTTTYGGPTGAYGGVFRIVP